MEEGRSIRHEPVGEVVEVGGMVCLPFNVARGFCENCERGSPNYCYTMQPQEGSVKRAGRRSSPS